MNKSIRLLLFLLGFLGIGALGGGATFILSPDGSLIGMPVSVLVSSPFRSFLLPGIILFVVLGICPCLLIVGLIKKPSSQLAEWINLFGDMHWSWSFALYTAFGLVIWIQLQMVFLQAIHWLHTFYMFYAIVLVIVCLLPSVRLAYRKISKL